MLIFTYTTVTYESLHQALCSDGDDGCGGSFEHMRGIDELIQATINAVIPPTTDEASTVAQDAAVCAATTSDVAGNAVAEPIVIDESDDEALQITQQPQIADIATQPSKGLALNDLTDLYLT